MSTTGIREIVLTRFGGKLAAGKHQEDGVACVLEAASVARGKRWTDSPEVVGLPDLRGLNDSPSWPSAEVRAEYMIPVVEALWDWPLWSREKRARCLARVAERTIREIVPLALEAAASVQKKEEHQKALRDAAERCRAEGTPAASKDAQKIAAAYAAYAADAADAAADAADAAADAYAAAAAAYAYDAYADDAAAYAADAAAYADAAAADADADAAQPLMLACRIWIECAQEVNA